jgi:hypothetical protein
VEGDDVTTLGSLVANAHNAWLRQPLWARTGEGAIAAGVIALAMAFNWTIPHSLADVQVQVLAFWVLALPTVISIFKSSLLPGIVRWFLDQFGFAPASKVQRPAAGGLVRGDIWVRF